MMKKILMIMMIFGLWTASCAFTSVDTGSMIYSSGQVLEVVSFKYDDSTLTALDVSREDFETELTGAGEYAKNYLKQIVGNDIDNLPNYSNAQKASLKQKHILLGNEVYSEYGELAVYISYSSIAIWNLFCQDVIESAPTELKTSLFTKTQTTTMEIKQSKFTSNLVKAYLYDIVYEKVVDYLEAEYSSLLVESILPSEFSYSYATTNRRVHSNSTSPVAFEQSTGLYYHTWKFADTSNTTITLYTTYANTITWYILALGLTLVFTSVLIIVNHTKNKSKKIKKDEN